MNTRRNVTNKDSEVLLTQILLGTNTALWGLLANQLLLFLVGVVVLLLVALVVSKRWHLWRVSARA
jgi:hypothetical protein